MNHVRDPAKAGARALTELEACALAIVWKRGPCSAYAVRREFAESTSPEWSASAGSVYPVMARLDSLGLIAAEQRTWGRRSKRLYVPTPEGRERVRAWIAQSAQAAAGAPPDPLRTRMYFLEALPDDAARLAFIQRAEAQTRAEIEAVSAALQDSPSDAVLDRLAGEGAIFALQARLQWLAHVREALWPGAGG